ncbi:class I adenylate-forming enzyme family protein [Cumulibacter soli]|uniref:class I adenylate-forming enzyme family protein n=1 Tax=Cumulibacter soli TaxID=2546344 RepID=UPI001067A0F2|nr:AMP-binding protein [Cumulibacter soli]
MLVDEIVGNHAIHRPNDEALVVGAKRFTYGQLGAQIDDVSAALLAAGVAKGDRVAVLSHNCIEYFLLYFATARVGAILVPLNFWHRESEHAYVLEDCAPVLLFTEASLRSSLGTLEPSLRVIALPDDDGDHDWPDFLAGSEESAPQASPVYDDDPHMILYTSGTTGRPKGAVLSHRRTVDDGVNMSSGFRPRSTDTFLNYFPPFHVGNWDHMKLFLIVGARVILQTQFDAKIALETIEEERVTVILGVPTMLHSLMEEPSFRTTDLSSIRMLYYGAYDPSGIMRRIGDALGVPRGECEMAHTFGLTEGGPFVMLCEPEDIEAHWGSVGRPLPGIRAELRNDAGEPVPAGGSGELWFTGPMMTEYWNRPDDTAKTIVNGWLATGDVMQTDSDGFYYVVDRKKDVIRSGGQNVFSKAIEDRVLEHPNVLEAAVIGLPDPIYEESVTAVIVTDLPEDRHTKFAGEIQQFVRAELAGYNTPRSVIFVDELPRNAVGKVRKNVLRDTYGSLFTTARHGDA